MADETPAWMSASTALVRDVTDLPHAICRFMLDVPVAQAAIELLAKSEHGDQPLVAALCAAYALDSYGLVAADQKTLRLAVLGAERDDTGMAGRFYQLVRWFLGRPDLNISIELVGPSLETSPKGPRLDVRELFARGAEFKETCGAWWTARLAEGLPPPDVLLVFHPTLDTLGAGWLVPGQLPAILKAGIPAVVFAYDLDEAQRNAYILEAHGSKIEGLRSCPMGAVAQFGQSEDPEKFLAAHRAFAAAMFLVRDFAADGLHEESIREMRQLSTAIREVFKNEQRLEHHTDAFRPCHVERCSGSKRVHHVFGALYYDPDEGGEIFLGHRGREIEGTPRFPGDATSAQLSTADSALKRAMIAARLYTQLAVAAEEVQPSSEGDSEAGLFQ